MNLKELKYRKLDVLHDLADKALCNYSTSSTKALSAHMQTCEKCIRMKMLGDEYQAIRKAEKTLQGRTNAVLNYGDPERIKWRKFAVENGVKAKTYDNRIGRGMSFKDAATTPIIKPQEAGKRSVEARRKRA